MGKIYNRIIYIDEGLSSRNKKGILLKQLIAKIIVTIIGTAGTPVNIFAEL